MACRTPLWYQGYFNETHAKGALAGPAQQFEFIFRQCQFTPARPGYVLSCNLICSIAFYWELYRLGVDALYLIFIQFQFTFLSRYAYLAWQQQSPLWWTRNMDPVITDKNKELFLAVSRPQAISNSNISFLYTNSRRLVWLFLIWCLCSSPIDRHAGSWDPGKILTPWCLPCISEWIYRCGMWEFWDFFADHYMLSRSSDSRWDCILRRISLYCVGEIPSTILPYHICLGQSDRRVPENACNVPSNCLFPTPSLQEYVFGFAGIIRSVHRNTASSNIFLFFFSLYYFSRVPHTKL